METHTNQRVKLHNKTFEPFIGPEEIREVVQNLGEQLNRDYAGKKPLFIGILNGVFVFAADLMRELCMDNEISFVKLASYEGTHTTGTVRELIGLGTSIKDRHVIILEDIVDTGNTLAKTIPGLLDMQPASLEIATLLFKPEALQNDLKLKYIGREIPNKFIVGYGLDYDGLGRHLRGIYQLCED
jgi:hypoxanthine phosphoribosyltransferase